MKLFDEQWKKLMEEIMQRGVSGLGKLAEDITPQMSNTSKHTLFCIGNLQNCERRAQGIVSANVF